MDGIAVAVVVGVVVDGAVVVVVGGGAVDIAAFRPFDNIQAKINA